jgi:hypothetical protein
MFSLPKCIIASMRLRSPGVRALLALTLALQLALPGAVAWADARLDAADALARPHFESRTAASCVRIHSAACALCRFLATTFAATHGVTVARAALDRQAATPGTVVAPPTRPATTAVHSRAPPALS